MRYGLKWPVYRDEWDRMEIRPSRVGEFTRLAQFALNHKDIYEDIEKRTGVPWWLVAVLHRRESDADFRTYLGNGDPLNRPTRHVPRGRGPFDSFADGAVDALKLDGLTNVKDWRLEKALYECEIFNGTGYNNRGLPSPYIWGGSNIQKRGKYIGDGEWDGDAWDIQPGCAPIIQMIAKLDPSVTLERET